MEKSRTLKAERRSVTPKFTVTRFEIKVTPCRRVILEKLKVPQLFQKTQSLDL
jgi:hypothetical protein